MAEMPESEVVEVRYGGYYVGTRIPLHVLVDQTGEGETAESLLDLYHPYLHTIEKIRGALAFIAAHPDAVERYLKQEDERFDQICREHPLPGEVLDSFRRMRDEKTRKSA